MNAKKKSPIVVYYKMMMSNPRDAVYNTLYTAMIHTAQYDTRHYQYMNVTNSISAIIYFIYKLYWYHTVHIHHTTCIETQQQRNHFFDEHTRTTD